MTPRWLHRLTVLLASCTLVLVIAGATVVSQARTGGPVVQSHWVLGIAVAAMGLAASVSVWRLHSERGVRRFALAVIPLLAAASVPGGIGHALAAHLFFAATCMLALFTSPAWSGTRLGLNDGGWPTLRSLAYITPATVVIQIALGAAYRHKVTGVVPHVAWAFAAIIIVMMLGAFLLTHDQVSRPIRRAALWLLSLAGIQVILGITAFVMRLDGLGAGPVWMAITTVAHAAAGSLVLGLTAVLSAQVLRNFNRTHEAPAAPPPLVSAERLS